MANHGYLLDDALRQPLSMVRNRDDAMAGARAGFVGREDSQGCSASAWKMRDELELRFTYFISARRDAV